LIVIILNILQEDISMPKYIWTLILLGCLNQGHSAEVSEDPVFASVEQERKTVAKGKISVAVDLGWDESF